MMFVCKMTRFAMILNAFIARQGADYGIKHSLKKPFVLPILHGRLSNTAEMRGWKICHGCGAGPLRIPCLAVAHLVRRLCTDGA